MAEGSVNDDDHRELLTLIRQQVRGGDTHNPAEVRELYELLNSQPTTYSATSLSSSREATGSQVRSLLNGPIVLADTLHPRSGLKERNTDGRRVVGDPVRCQTAEIDFVNGISTHYAEGIAGAFLLEKALDRDVGHIHNRAGLFLGEITEAGLQGARLNNSPVVISVATQIREHAEAGRPYILICHSQGATICKEGMRRVIEMANGQLQHAIKRNTAVLTIGGFAQQSDFDPGVFLSMIEHPDDPVPNLARALDPLNPLSLWELVKALKDLLTACTHSLSDAKGSGCAGYLSEGRREEVQQALAMLETSLHANCTGQGCGCTPTPTPTPASSPTPTPLCQTDLDCPNQNDGDADCLRWSCFMGACELYAEPSGSPCDDGLACTEGDLCSVFGYCSYAANVCPVATPLQPSKKLGVTTGVSWPSKMAAIRRM